VFYYDSKVEFFFNIVYSILCGVIGKGNLSFFYDRKQELRSLYYEKHKDILDTHMALVAGKLLLYMAKGGDLPFSLSMTVKRFCLTPEAARRFWPITLKH